MTQEIRCTATHPRLRGRSCNGKLADVVDGTVTVLVAQDLRAIGAGCALLACPRCGVVYVLAPRPVAGERVAG